MGKIDFDERYFTHLKINVSHCFQVIRIMSCAVQFCFIKYFRSVIGIHRRNQTNDFSSIQLTHPRNQTGNFLSEKNELRSSLCWYVKE